MKRRFLVSYLIALSLFAGVSFFAPLALAQTCEALFTKSSLPPLSVLKEKLPAVHLTDYFPSGGKIENYPEVRTRFSPTIHFALGGPVIDHDFGRWATKKYAVVLPVRDISNQLLNVFTQDAFTLGAVTLSKDARVFVPRGEIPGDVGLAKVIFYDPKVPIKKVVVDFLKSERWIQLRGTGSKPKDDVFYEGENVNDRKFWEGLATNPVRYELHATTPWGRLDMLVLNEFKGVFEFRMPETRELEEVRYNLEEMRALMIQIETEYRNMKGLPPGTDQVYRRALAPIKNTFLKILEAEEKLQAVDGKTLMGWDEGRKAGIMKALQTSTDIASFVNENLARLPTVEQAKAFGPLYFKLSLSGKDYDLNSLIKNGSLPDYASTNKALVRQLKEYHQKRAEIVKLANAVRGAYLSEETKSRISVAMLPGTYELFLAQELELRTNHGKSMLDMQSGPQKLAAALQSSDPSVALKQLIRENLIEMKIYKE